MPDVVGVLSYNAGWGGVWAKLAYDEQIANIGAKLPIPAVPGFATNGSFAAQLGVQINVPNVKGSSFRLIGYYSDADNAYGPAPFRGTKFPYTTLGSAEWSVLASYRHQFSPTFAAVVAGQYFKDFYIAGTSINSNVDGWQGELELVWTPVENFEVRTAVAYRDIDAAGFNGSTSGFLRFVRSF